MLASDHALATPAPAPAPAPSYRTEQRYGAYTAENHAVWALLYRERMATLRETGSERFLQGIDAIGLSPDRVPELDDVNGRLRPRTGWRAEAVTGFVPAADFFGCLAGRRFPTTVIVRPADQLAYLPEPDIFHDVFGHVPLHADPVFADTLQQLGRLGAAARNERQVEALARLFWFTVEFGLVREGGAVRIYGSGLISSSGDAANALGDRCDRRPFDLDRVLAQPFVIDRFQDVLFVLEDFGQLLAAVDAAAGRLGLAV